MNLVRLYVAGNVARWHQNPVMASTGQTDADHQGRCVQLLLALNPDASPALIRAVAFHDVGELDAGDLSHDFKKANPHIAATHAAFESIARQEICGPDPDLSADERRWVELVDRLESACWVLLTRPEEYRRPCSRWTLAEPLLQVAADDLGCGDAVRGLLHDLKGGLW